MGRTILTAAVLFGLLAGVCVAQGQDRGIGAGIILGEPTGLSAKGWVSQTNAVDLALSWAFGRSGYFAVHADYLWHFPRVVQTDERIVLYAGIGGRFGVPRRKGILGLRVPVGIAYWPRRIPLDIFLEVAPVLDLIPATEMSGNAGIGVRYFF